MIINATQIRVGMVLILEKELYRVNWTMHRTPGKGNACMQTKLRNIKDGKNLEKRFLSSERVEKADLDTRKMQYLYEEDAGFVFMDNTSFEQLSLAKDLAEGADKFLKEGDDYLVTFNVEDPIGLELPKSIEVKVSMAPPEVRKATASASLRPVELENGMTVNAPAFIKEGDTIRINTETGDYIERV
jgi:elongation factor P